MSPPRGPLAVAAPPRYPGAGSPHGAYQPEHLGDVVQLLAEIQQDVGRAVRTHAESRFSDSFALSGSATVAAGGNAPVITMTPPAGYAWRLTELGCTVEGDAFDDGSGAVGIAFQILRAGSPLPFLDRIDFPLGSIPQRGRIHVAGNPAEQLVIRALNFDALNPHGVCAAIVGHFYAVKDGGA